jgi:excinuclease UvrABC nuclease subunit
MRINIFERGFYCYKWIKDGEVVYIGKTVSPKLRIAQERKIDKFQEILDADIYVTSLLNQTEMDGLEKLLINKYQPRLNVVDRNLVFYYITYFLVCKTIILPISFICTFLHRKSKKSITC